MKPRYAYTSLHVKAPGAPPIFSIEFSNDVLTFFDKIDKYFAKHVGSPGEDIMRRIIASSSPEDYSNYPDGWPVKLVANLKEPGERDLRNYIVGAYSAAISRAWNGESWGC